MSRKKKENRTIEESDNYFEEIEDEDYDVGYHEEVKLDFEKVKSSFLGMEDWTGGIPASQVNLALRKKKNEEEHEKVMGVFHVILYTICFSGIIMCSAEYGNVRFQTMEFYYARVALLFFVAVLWGLQRVKLFNWQSLLLTLIYTPYSIFYWTNQAVAPDISMAVITELAVRWMILMLLIDMMIKKNLRQNNKFIPTAFALFCVMSVFTLMNRSGSMVPIVYLYFIIMCFIPVNAREWERVQESMFYGGFIAFVAITICSFTGDPFVKIPRDYFMITDDLGQVFGLSMALAAFGLLHFGEKYGRISASYFLSAFWFVASIVMAVYKGTDGIILGAVFLLFFLFVFGIGSKKRLYIFIRLGIALVLLAAVVVLIIIGANKIVQPDFDPAAFSAAVMQSPLKNLPELAEEIIGKAESAHMGSGAYREMIKPNTVGAVINVFLDSRIAMFFEALAGISVDGHPITGEAGAFVLAAKVQYLQYLYQFGYFAGGLNLLLFVGLWITSIVKYLKTKKMWYLMPMLLFAMTFGAWFNVSSGLFYSMVFFSVLSLYPLLVEIRPGRKKKKKKKGEEPKETNRLEKEDEAEGMVAAVSAATAGTAGNDEAAKDADSVDGTAKKADKKQKKKEKSKKKEDGEQTGKQKDENAQTGKQKDETAKAGKKKDVSASDDESGLTDGKNGIPDSEEEDRIPDAGFDEPIEYEDEDEDYYDASQDGEEDSDEALQDGDEEDDEALQDGDEEDDEALKDEDGQEDDEEKYAGVSSEDETEEEVIASDTFFDDESEEESMEDESAEDDGQNDGIAFVPLSTAEIHIAEPEPVVNPRKKKRIVIEEGRPIDRGALEDVAIVDLVPIHPGTGKTEGTDKPGSGK